jgi:hypothetical protein
VVALLDYHGTSEFCGNDGICLLLKMVDIMMVTKLTLLEVLVNPMGRDVDSNNLGQNHSQNVNGMLRPYLDRKRRTKTTHNIYYDVR